MAPPVQPAALQASPRTLKPTAAAEWLASTRAAQGLPPEVVDPEAITRLALLLLDRKGRRRG